MTNCCLAYLHGETLSNKMLIMKSFEGGKLMGWDIAAHDFFFLCIEC